MRDEIHAGILRMVTKVPSLLLISYGLICLGFFVKYDVARHLNIVEGANNQCNSRTCLRP